MQVHNDYRPIERKYELECILFVLCWLFGWKYLCFGVRWWRCSQRVLGIDLEEFIKDEVNHM